VPDEKTAVIEPELAGLLSLDHHVRLYIPTTSNGTSKLDDSEIESWTAKVVDVFSSLFGGATRHDAIGAWRSPVHGIVSEKVIIVEAYGTKEQMEESLGSVISLGREMRSVLGQEIVSMEYDG